MNNQSRIKEKKNTYAELLDNSRHNRLLDDINNISGFYKSENRIDDILDEKFTNNKHKDISYNMKHDLLDNEILVSEYKENLKNNNNGSQFHIMNLEEFKFPNAKKKENTSPNIHLNKSKNNSNIDDNTMVKDVNREYFYF